MIPGITFGGAVRRRRAEKENRPKLRPEMAPIDWLLELMALLILLTFIGYVFYYYPKLPATIPTHFNGSGAPDDYSSKDSFWGLPGIGLFIYVLLTLIAMVPHQFNFTVKITPENAIRQYALAVRLIRYLKTAIILLFFGISMATVRVAEKSGTGLGLWFIPVVPAGIIFPIIIYMIVATKNR